MDKQPNRQADRPLQSNGHMDRHRENDWATIRYDARFDIYELKAGSAWQQLYYCPWCGDKLPPSRRADWFEELEAKGIDPMNEDYPDAYKTAAWRQSG